MTAVGQPIDTAADGSSSQLARLTEQELDIKFPNRPRNHHQTLPFNDLNEYLFSPLSETKKRSGGPLVARRKQGPHGASTSTPQEQKRSIISNFFARWRRDVGDDVYPAFRLLLPDKDKERPMYGLKEKTIAKLLIRLVKINKDSEDAVNLMNWRLPGHRSANTAMLAGDFAARCHHILAKRSTRTAPGDMTIQQVNDKLDELSLAQKEDKQLAIMQEFYLKMNVNEMTWLIRIILRQMKIGATEKTLFDIWHPDADTLFNISSSLRRVCWELSDPSITLPGENTDITLMSCFQPQLAQFQLHSFEKMVQRLHPTEDDDEFWIEEKLDGERMQLHMVEDHRLPGGKRFGFWSRKAKEYTYLYGSHLEQNDGALTKYLKDAFDQDVRNIILDGEMITWDPVRDKIVPFGTLKTAALNEKTDASENKERPFYRVFDILYLNDKPLAKFMLRDRRRALEGAVHPVHRRLDILPHKIGHKASDIEPELREIVAEASEGLVLKNPRSMYRLNDRNDDWMKVKPEYMTGFGHDLDCLVIGGYWGSGRRGGYLSSFMCGLRVPNQDPGAAEQKWWSFCRVGGGFSAADYATIRHHTDGKWHEWDAKQPPPWIELAADRTQREQPDMWILPSDSLVISIKAASVTESKTFRTRETLRFPRLKVLRPDRKWDDALTYQEFVSIKNDKDKEQQDKQFLLEQRRRQKPNKRQKREMTVAGALSRTEMDKLLPEADTAKDLFLGLTFFVMSESTNVSKKSKHEIEAFVKGHGGKITQTATMKTAHVPESSVICIADRRLVKVSSLIKQGSHTIVRPRWLFDCVEQAKIDIAKGREPLLLPWEPRSVLFVADADKRMIGDAADEWTDAYSRDVMTVGEMRQILEEMPSGLDLPPATSAMSENWVQTGQHEDTLLGDMFQNCVVWFDRGHDADAMDVDGADGTSRQSLTLEEETASNVIQFAGGRIAGTLDETDITHIISLAQGSNSHEVRLKVSSRRPVPHIVTSAWISDSWAERTLLDESRFQVTSS